MESVYNKIVDTIEQNAALFTEAGVSVPQTVDVYLGQPSAPDQFEFALPAVFVDYSADYDAELLYVYLHVLQDFGDDTENFAPNSSEGLSYFRFLTVLKRCLKGIKTPPVFGALKLYQETPVQTEFFNYHTLAFRCTLNTSLYPEIIKYIDVAFDTSVTGGQLKDKR